MRLISATIGLAMATLTLLATGCDRATPPAGPATTTQPASKEPALAELAAGWDKWPLGTAVANLEHEALARSAAVRLVRLAEATPAMVPDPLPAALADALSVVSLGDAGWALGVAERDAPERLWGPVLISPIGEVTIVAEDHAEPVVLHIADEPTVFPHVVLTRDEVVLPVQPGDSAIWLVSPDSVGFALREQDGFPYVGLVLWAQRDVEVARYLWDPYELVFTGPAIDHLPDPPGGVFEIDLESSEHLVPQGGLIDKPEPMPERPAIPPGREVEPV